MESVIKWQIGEPKEDCNCITTIDTGDIVMVSFSIHYKWYHYTDRVIAWCPLSEIEPYKEKDGTSRLK